MPLTNNPNLVTPLAISAVGAAQSNAAVLPATAGKLTYISGFDVAGGGATSASVVEVAITGLPSAVGTLKYEMNVLAGAAGPVNAQGGLFIRFPDPIPASAVNGAITVTLPSLGSGNTNASVTAYGFQL